MSYITLKCKNCGANMSLNTESHSATCNHCGSTFLIGDLLDEKDIAFTEQFTPKNLEQKMMAQESLKQGDTYLFQAEYEKAEITFKRAIELDDTNYKAYLGVVKAKTHNLNIIPENDDYIQYADYAISLAEGDELLIVKSELAKIKLLKRENVRMKKAKMEKEKQEEQLRKEKQGILKITSVICVIILIVFCSFVFLGSNLFSKIFKGKGSAKNIDIDTYEKLVQVFSSDDYLDCNLTLTSDIDCNNKTITPLGSSTKAFTGTFNGNKHTISNATIISGADNKISNLVGLFGHTNLAKINNLVLDKITISVQESDSSDNTCYIGLLVGKAEATTIHNIEVKNSCYITLNGNFEYDLSLGGLVGSALNSTHIFSISCHPNISLTSHQTLKSSISYIGSIVGLSNNSIIQKTCSSSAIYSSHTNNSINKSTAYVSGIIGHIKNATETNIKNISNNYFSGIITSFATNTDFRMSAIASSEVSATSKLNNYCLFTSSNTTTPPTTNFMLSNTSLLRTNLYDYSSTNYFVEFCYSYTSFMSNFSEVFASWENNNTYTPNLV